MFFKVPHFFTLCITSLVLLLGGCQKSFRTDQRTIAHLNNKTADFIANQNDGLTIYSKVCNEKENRYYFDKKKLPFNALKLTFDNQSKHDFAFDPQKAGFRLAEKELVISSVRSRTKDACALGVIPIAIGGGILAAFFAKGGIALIGGYVLGPIIGAACVGAFVLTATGALSSGAYMFIHRRKNKEAITENINHSRRTMCVPAGQQRTTFLFISKDQNNLHSILDKLDARH